MQVSDSLLRDTGGATSIEYAVLVAAVALLSYATWIGYRGGNEGALDQVGDEILVIHTGSSVGGADGSGPGADTTGSPGTDSHVGAGTSALEGAAAVEAALAGASGPGVPGSIIGSSAGGGGESGGVAGGSGASSPDVGATGAALADTAGDHRSPSAPPIVDTSADGDGGNPYNGDVESPLWPTGGPEAGAEIHDDGPGFFASLWDGLMGNGIPDVHAGMSPSNVGMGAGIVLSELGPDKLVAAWDTIKETGRAIFTDDGSMEDIGWAAAGFLPGDAVIGAVAGMVKAAKRGPDGDGGLLDEAIAATDSNAASSRTVPDAPRAPNARSIGLANQELDEATAQLNSRMLQDAANPGGRVTPQDLDEVRAMQREQDSFFMRHDQGSLDEATLERQNDLREQASRHLAGLTQRRIGQLTETAEQAQRSYADASRRFIEAKDRAAAAMPNFREGYHMPHRIRQAEASAAEAIQEARGAVSDARRHNLERRMVQDELRDIVPDAQSNVDRLVNERIEDLDFHRQPLANAESEYRAALARADEYRRRKGWPVPNRAAEGGSDELSDTLLEAVQRSQ